MAGSRFVNSRFKSVTAGITASTSQSQGNGVLTSDVNEIDVVGSTDDTVTLPSALAGLEVTVINNGGNTLQIFPASGDDLGAGVNLSQQLEPNESVEYIAYDSTNWHIQASTEIAHAVMFDTNNGDAFAIIDAGSDQQAYHTNGLVAGNLAGWTFDAGGAGTSHAIASIEDSPTTLVQISVTTSDPHGLAVGDIISQTNLSDSAYTGFFVVKVVTSSTVYEVEASFTATGTGTMDQAATLICDPSAAGDYAVHWSASATAQTNNDIFTFAIHVEATHIGSTNQKRKFGIAADVGSMSGVGIIPVGAGEHVSFMVFNESGTGDITLINFAMVLVRL